MTAKKKFGTKRVLGFDASTKTIGVSVIDYNPHWVTARPSVELVHSEFYKPPTKGTIFQRLSTVRNQIEEYLHDWEPDDVAIEDIVLFMSGLSTAKTITSLAIFNRMVGLTVFDKMRKGPTLLSVMAVRHALKLDKVLPKKEEMPDLVSHHLQIPFPWIVNKKGAIASESYDVADSIAVGLAFILKSAEKPARASVKKKKARVRRVDGDK